ncbi:hypothetical protein [Undibacterium parvum]|uniref:Uncharacterized protein n=1 Tax=Undibacterium parvum TaxID=401471 RepID=A0A3S9HEW2_9BURK|nr:hypothetical protein [Undibacterium parvum]AZP10704.1 hypothetical protein EJN92_00860 [Undibacterium parvum]
MKKSIAVRLVLSAITLLLTPVLNSLLMPTAVLVSGNAALGQMTSSEASYVSAIAGMNLGSMLSGTPGILLFLALLLIWGSLLINRKHK